MIGRLIDPSGAPRCEVCALPLPRGEESGVCSRRCAVLRRQATALTGRRNELIAAVLAELDRLETTATICPGELARRILPGKREPLSLLRPLLFELEQERKVALLQKGEVVPWWKIRGPFRVRRR